MGKISIIFGVLLVLLGVGVFAGLTVAEGEMPSKTALIPAFFGLLIVPLGIAAMKDSLRMHAMHFIALLALLGVIAPLGRLGMQLAKGADVAMLSLASLVLMALLCGGLLAACIKSFKDARRRQKQTQREA